MPLGTDSEELRVVMCKTLDTDVWMEGLSDLI